MPSIPSLSRREFIGTTVTATVGLTACASRRTSDPSGDVLLHVGTYTANTASEGVYRVRMNAATGALTILGASPAGPNPSFLALHPTRRTLYAVNETASGALSALAVGGDGALAPNGTRPSRGADPCYASVDRTGHFALVANYSGGSVAALPIAADGTLGDATAFVQHAGSGPNAARQQAPHAHCIIPDPTNRYALAADLGADRVFVYRFDDRAGTLVPAATPFAALAPGAGPRHLAFHPNGRLLWVVNELDLTIAGFRWDASLGALSPIQTLPLVPGLAPGAPSAADLHVAPSGRFVYASVRGDNSIVAFAVDAATGMLSPVQRVSTGGDWPRNFALDPSGRFLLVANQRSNDVVVFTVDATSGRLTPTGARASVPAPVCLRFAGA